MSGLGLDRSGNGHHWTPTNLAPTDVVLDTPTNNFCTMNVLHGSSMGYSEGNLKLQSSGSNGSTRGTVAMTSGKWYWEMYIQSASGTFNHHIGVQYSGAKNGYDGDDRIVLRNDGVVYGATQGTTTISSIGVGDILGITFDADTNTLQYYKNNSTNGSAFTAPTTDTPYTPHFLGNATSGYIVFNFGQDSSFAGNKTAQSNTDDNGYGDFYYEPPEGFLALCTDNLPCPTVVPSEHFGVVTYTGNGTGQSITGVGFQSDLVYIKSRNQAGSSNVYDVVRGVSAGNLTTNALAADSGNADNFTSFDSDGFTLPADTAGYNNINNRTYVAWCWKANGTSVLNENGTIDSQVSANQDAGFSIVSYTGTGANATVGHGLSSAPEMIIAKSRTDSQHWSVYHASAGNQYGFRLNEAHAQIDFPYWNDTTPTSSVFSIGGNDFTNKSSSNFIAYCFHSVEGYSKVGSYTGNGNADGTFVYCGFKPRYVMIKSTDMNLSWYIHDTAREPENPVDLRLVADGAHAEASEQPRNMLSNGFKLRGTSVGTNASGSTYIYIAFAETPFKYSNAR